MYDVMAINTTMPSSIQEAKSLHTRASKLGIDIPHPVPLSETNKHLASLEKSPRKKAFGTLQIIFSQYDSTLTSEESKEVLHKQQFDIAQV